MDVDVGLWHQKERQTCLFGSGTRRGWLVARGSVCQMQVVSNHSSGVAARNHPFWQGSRAGTWGQMPGTARASRPSAQSLSGGPDRPISLHRATQTHNGFVQRLLLLAVYVPVYLRTSLRLQVR